MNEMITEDFLTLWKKHKDFGINNIIGRMSVENRPKIQSWVRKLGHFDLSYAVLFDHQHLKDEYYLCRYMI